MTEINVDKQFHPLLQPVARRTIEQLTDLNRKVYARPGVSAIDERGEFTQHWTSHLRELCELVHGDARGEVRSILEIGAFEGRSTVFLATFFPNAHIDTIDTFAGSDEHVAMQRAEPLETMFDRNTAAFAGRITKHRGYSYDHLPRLHAAGRRFDVAFIDGSHFADDIYVDTFYCWAMLKPGGVLIWDDYLWGEYANRLANPPAAIERFLEVHAGDYEPLFAEWLVAIRKNETEKARAFWQPRQSRRSRMIRFVLEKLGLGSWQR